MRESSSYSVPTGYPNWVDRVYLTDILRKEFPNNYKIIDLHIEDLNEKGENFASVMFRVKVAVENENSEISHLHLVVKAGHSTEKAKQFFSVFNAFSKEIDMYKEILPKLESTIHAIGETTLRFSPKCFLVTADPSEVIIMNDLNTLGYRAADRFAGLNLDHVHLVLGKLAKFHATSAVLIDRGYSFGQKYDEGFYGDNLRSTFCEMTKRSTSFLNETIKRWKCADLFKDLPENWRLNMMNKLFDMAKRDDKRFNVLCHGDLWCNNIMFRYDGENGQVDDCLLVDFQFPIYGSPIYDLQYFFISSMEHTLKMTQMDNLIAFYHQQLVMNLTALSYSRKMPELQDLQKDFLDLGLFQLANAFGIFRVAVAPKTNDMDLETMLRKPIVTQQLYTNPIFVNALEDLIPMFAENGFLEMCKD